jgi:hypothetical protein
VAARVGLDDVVTADTGQSAAMIAVHVLATAVSAVLPADPITIVGADGTAWTVGRPPSPTPR